MSGNQKTAAVRRYLDELADLRGETHGKPSVAPGGVGEPTGGGGVVLRRG